MSRLLKIAFWATVAGQIILLLAFVGVKENALRTGTTVLLQTVPVDPRSLLQGDFVILDYEIAQLPDWMQNLNQGQSVYVRLREDQSGVWRAQSYYSPVKPGSGEVFIKGEVNSRRRLDFKIGNYFVPEGTGHVIERSRVVKVQVVVSSEGAAVIKALLVDGQPFDPSRPVPDDTVVPGPPPPPVPE